MYIGAENIASPLGMSAEENFESLLEGKSGIQLHKEIGFDKKDLYISKFAEIFFTPKDLRFDTIIIDSIETTLLKTVNFDIKQEDVLVIISSTKGNIDHLDSKNEKFSLTQSAQTVKNHFELANFPLIISNACISGVMALNMASNLIESKQYKHVICVGADIISDFVLWGFQSLFAISDKACKPFDAERKGISMGEGAASVLVTENETLFKEKPLKILSGFTTNDANHISGPSRTGEGLYRAINQTLKKHKLTKNDIDHISGHGTATLYNDEMESIAFSRLQMLDIPINSLKAYYGHTLGAAGLIESVISMQSIRNNKLIKSEGFEKQGTTHKLNIIEKNEDKEVNCVLKTASGFGGCNAALVILNHKVHEETRRK